MRVIYLHQYFVTPSMAGGTRSYEMARRLVAAGHEVHMVTTDQHSSPNAKMWRYSTEAGIHVYWANVPYSSHMGYLRRIIAFLSFSIAATVRATRLQGDLIFATSTPLTIAIPALLVSAWKKVPFVFEVRDLWPDVPIAIGAIKNPLIRWISKKLEILAYRRAKRIIALAPGMREDIIAKGILPGKVCVIPNGCDVDVFSQPPTDCRERQPWLGSRRLILFAGTLGVVNGPDYFALLAAATRKIDPEIRFLMIGDGIERESTLQLAARLGILDRTFFWLAAMPKKELSAWVCEADIVIALFTGPRIVWKDAVQNKFFDALAAGKPIASNFDGWQSRIANDAGVGLILDANDTNLAATQLVSALNDSDWLSKVPERAQALANGRFSRDKLAADLEQVLRAVLGETSQGADPSISETSN